MPPRRIPPAPLRRARFLLAAALTTATFSCGGAPPGQPATPADAPGEAAGPAPTESERIVARMIEAHGGMEAFDSAPAVSFEDLIAPAGAPQGMNTRVTVEQGLRRAYIDVIGTDMRMAWDGERAWSVNWTLPPPPRFLALLNYYFLVLPWLAADPGVILGEPGTATIPGEDTEYVTIKMTFEPGVGDTPDDYYVLYIHPETHELRANEYIVTYRPILPEGVEATEPHLLVYDEWTVVDGLKVPVKYTIWEDGEVYATCRVRDWSFSRPFDASRLAMPEGAVIDASLTPAGA